MPLSRIPRTTQSGPHPRLEAVVRRHLVSSWSQPVREHSRQAFEAVRERLVGAQRLVLDAGCGSAVSTVRLAERYPEALIVGIDKSAARLARAPALPANALLVRAELTDFWRLMRSAGIRPARHCLFYPNPWPKPAHFKRRWHGHPVFPELVGLGGVLELRTNFELYVLEFAAALGVVGVKHVEVVSLADIEPVSPFERKYQASGHRLWKLTVKLGAGP